MDKLKIIQQRPASLDDLIEALDSKLFKTLGEPVRLEIIRSLLNKGRSDISAISESLPQDRSVISRHLNLMDDAGLLIPEKDGRHMYYEINAAAFIEKLESIVASIKLCMKECCP